MNKQELSCNVYNSTAKWKEGVHYYLGFLVWPFGSLLAAFYHWKEPWSKNVFWLFCIFLGFTFIIAERGGADSARYAEIFVNMAHSDLNIGRLFESFYSEVSEDPDILSPIFMFLISRVTDNPIALFTVYGVFFGFFYSRNLWFIFNRIESKVTFIVFLLIITFALVNPIWNINGFRFWAAAQVYLFGALPFLLEGNKKSLLWSGLSIFIHYSFTLPVAILGLFYVLRNKTNLYLAFYIATSFLQELDLQWFQSILSFLPDVFFSEVQTYANPVYAEYRNQINQNLPWFVTLPLEGLKWVNYVFIGSFFIIGKKFLNSRDDLKTLLSFSLLFMGVANIISFVPSGGRFLVVANMFIYSFYIISFSAYLSIRKLFILQVLTVPWLLFFCIMAIRIGFDYIGALTIIGNPVSAGFYSYPVPLIEDIKRLFLF